MVPSLGRPIVKIEIRAAVHRYTCCQDTNKVLLQRKIGNDVTFNNGGRLTAVDQTAKNPYCVVQLEITKD